MVIVVVILTAIALFGVAAAFYAADIHKTGCLTRSGLCDHK